MSQAITNLSPGDQIYVQENGVDVVYDIAAFNHHTENSVTLVRHDIYGDGIQWHYELTNYEQSNLDLWMQWFESRYSAKHRQNIINTPVVCGLHTSTFETIYRKVFSLSRTEVGGSGAEGTRLPIFSDSASRIKAGSASYWWLRTIVTGSTSQAYRVRALTGVINEYDKDYKLGVVPAHVIKSDVSVSDNPDGTGVYSFAYPDFIPEDPILLSPIGGYFSVDEDIVLNWQHVIDTGTAQTKADIQYNVDGGTWTDLATVEGAEQTYTVTAGTLSVGNIQWRVRTYNSDEVAGEWSDPASFVGIGATQSPTIVNVTESFRPIISWQSVGQYGYQAQVRQNDAVVWDSGDVAGAVKSAQVPIYLENGIYEIRVRIVGQFLTWSEWSTYEITLNVTPPPAPTITVSPITYGARIAVDEYDESIVKAYLLRNGMPIADITGELSHDDLAALGSTSYVVRVIDESDNYADSNTVTTTVSVDGAILSPVDELSTTVKMHMKAADQPAVTRSKVLLGGSQHYAGREYPVHVFSEFANEEYAPAFYYTSLSDFVKLENLIDRRRTVLYRDTLGNRIYGVITGIDSTQENNMVVFTFRLERVDFVEEL